MTSSKDISDHNGSRLSRECLPGAQLTGDEVVATGKVLFLPHGLDNTATHFRQPSHRRIWSHNRG